MKKYFKVSTLLAALLMSVLVVSCSDSDEKEELDANVFAYAYISVTDEAGTDLLDPESDGFILDRNLYNSEHMDYEVDVNPDKDYGFSEPMTLKQRDGGYALYSHINTAYMRNALVSIPLADNRTPILLRYDISIRKNSTTVKSFLINDSPCKLYDNNVCTYIYVLK